MKSIISLSIAVLGALALSSCSPQVTAKQAASLQTTSVSMPTIKEKSYQKPTVASEASQQTANNVAMTAGLAGGLIGGAIGGLVVGGMQYAQQKNFEGINEQHIAHIEAVMDHRIEDDVHASMNRYLKYNPFFAQRLKPGSPTPIVTQITSYGLVRANSGKSELFNAQIEFTAHIQGPSGEKIAKTIATGTSATSATLPHYSANKMLLDTAFKEAADYAAADYSGKMKKATAKVR